MLDQPLATSAAITPPIIELSKESKNIPAPTRRRTRQWNDPIGRRSSRAAALTGLLIVPPEVRLDPTLRCRQAGQRGPRNRSTAATKARRMPGSSAECPASGTMVMRALRQAAARSNAVTAGQIIS